MAGASFVLLFSGHGEASRRFVRALVEGIWAFKANRDAYLRALEKYTRLTNRNVLLGIATYEGVWKAFSEDGNIPEDGLRLFIEQAKKAAKVEREISINEVTDPSILKVAQKELGIKGN